MLYPCERDSKWWRGLSDSDAVVLLVDSPSTVEYNASLDFGPYSNLGGVNVFLIIFSGSMHQSDPIISCGRPH